MAKIDANTVVTNMIWRFMERFGAQLVSVCVSLLLARLLDPSAYGTVVIIYAIMNILQIFIDSGLGNALVQKKDADDLDYSSVFYFNIVMCLVMYACMFLTAPYVARFYDMPELTALTRVLGIKLVISGVKNVQQAYVSRNMIFRKFFFATLGGAVSSAIVGVVMALQGFGVWALVAQNLISVISDTVILWFTVKWRPKLQFSWQRLKGLIRYGWKLLVSALLDTGYLELRNLLIGKVYSSTDLGYYDHGNKIPNMVVTNINTSITSVLFPAMSEVQDDQERIKQFTRRAIRISSYFMWPMMFGLIACAEPLIRVLLTEKWLPSAPIMQCVCITYGLRPIHTANLEAIKAMGRSDLFLKMELVKKAYSFTLLLIAMRYSIQMVAVSAVVVSLLSTVVNSFPNWKLLHYSYWEQVKDVVPPLLLSAFMAFVVMSIAPFFSNDMVLLLVQVPLGAAIYVAGSWLLKLESFYYVLNFIRRFLANRRAAKQ